MWESGERDASKHIHGIADLLKQPSDFFFGEEVPVTSARDVSFRRRRDAVRRIRDVSAAWIDLAHGILTPSVSSYFTKMPALDLPNLSSLSPANAAESLRKYWELGDYPIRDVVHHLEAKGVMIYWIGINEPSLSAFCKWVGNRPYIVLELSKGDGCRSRFDACHELGHLVLHQDLNYDQCDWRKVEGEADEFASAFLMPKSTFTMDCPRYVDFDRLNSMKATWKVSMQAMIRRMRDLNLITQWQYQEAFKEVSRRGWRSNAEPNAGPLETSYIHSRLCDKLGEMDKPPAEFAREANLSWKTIQEAMPVLRYREEQLRIKWFDTETPPFDI